MITDANGMPVLQPGVDPASTATFNTAFAQIGTVIDSARPLAAGTNPDTVTRTGRYSGYSWTGALQPGIAVLEVIVYSDDWILQRMTHIGVVPKTWVRSRHSGTTWGEWVPLATAGQDGAPWAMSAGHGTSSAAGAVTVTFPAGRFTQPPRVSVTPGNHPNLLTPRVPADPTATSFQVQLFTMPGGALVSANFDWIAVQMTSGSGSG